MITKGQEVKIKPEYCESKEELTKVWVVVSGEEDGGLAVIIEAKDFLGNPFNTQNRISPKFLEVVA